MLLKKQVDARYFQKLKRERHWIIAWKNARCRCSYKSTRGYHRYGGRGIKLLITQEDVKRLWIRDSADKMKCPSLDRKNNDGHYTYRNCRFIEKSENTMRKAVYRPKNCVSKYLGVCEGRRGKWLAQIQISNKRYWLGEFKTEIEASKAYQKAKSKVNHK